MAATLSGAIKKKKHDLVEENKFPKSFMIWDCISFKGPKEMAIIHSTINTFEILK